MRWMATTGPSGATPRCSDPFSCLVTLWANKFAPTNRRCWGEFVRPAARPVRKRGIQAICRAITGCRGVPTRSAGSLALWANKFAPTSRCCPVGTNGSPLQVGIIRQRRLASLPAPRRSSHEALAGKAVAPLAGQDRNPEPDRRRGPSVCRAGRPSRCLRP